MSNIKDIELKEKKELSSSLEQTKPGPVFIPQVDILETEKTLTVLADLPGVSMEDLTINIEDSVLTISGDVTSPEGSDENLYTKEYEVGKFYRQFRLSETIDQERIDAILKDGVLNLQLPKLEKAMPRMITVHAGE